MCGIFGVIGSPTPSPDLIERAQNSLSHRGPDTSDSISIPSITFGHTLLSIIGENPTKQPIWSRDGRGLLTFNGEIYNYLELLHNDPYLKKTCGDRKRSDTVVLLEGLRTYGTSFLQLVNGMFAFAYHDLDTGETLLVRDRLGIKPIYYSKLGGRIVFASESQAIRILTGQSFSPDPEGFYSYIRFRYPIFQRSFDRNIRQLLPGYFLRITPSGDIREESWWENNTAGGFTGTYHEAMEEVESLLYSSIEFRMRSDHDFSAFLSGGLDSSLIASIAATKKPQLDTYSIGMSDEKAFDESKYATLVANELSTHHHPHHLTSGEFQDEHRAFIQGRGEPVGVPNQVALKALSRQISKTHRVVLSGEGADEIMGGYGRIFLLPHDWHLIQSRANTSRPVTQKLIELYGAHMPETWTDLFLQRYAYTSNEFAVDVLKKSGFDIVTDHHLQSVRHDVETLMESIDTDSTFNMMLIIFQKLHLPGLLSRLDAVTMAHSIEARVPYLDHRLLEFANTLPFDFKVKPKKSRLQLVDLVADEISEVYDIPKSILKDLAQDRLSKDIIDRKKLGFPIPPSFYGPTTGRETVESNYESWVNVNFEILADVIPKESGTVYADC